MAFIFNITGNTYMSHQFQFRDAANTIGQIVPETCEAIYNMLKLDYFIVRELTAESQLLTFNVVSNVLFNQI